jgi:hypothetical protein
MPEPRRAPFSPHELKHLVEKLDEVMAEALKLREEVSRQLTEQNRGQQQRLSPPRSSGSRLTSARRRR